MAYAHRHSPDCSHRRRAAKGKFQKTNRLTGKAIDSPFSVIVNKAMTEGEVQRGSKTFYMTGTLHSTELLVATVGGDMEEVVDTLKNVNDAVSESKEILEELCNRTRSVGDEVISSLGDQVKVLRSSRMTVVTELQTALSSFKEVRKFFLDDVHDEEIARLREFVGLCERLQAMQSNGTLDALTDAVLKMSGVNDAGK